MMRDATSHGWWLPTAGFWLLAVGGCAGPDQSGRPGGDASPVSPASIEDVTWTDLPPAGESIEPRHNTARAAEQFVRRLGPLRRSGVRAALELHSVLYREAYEFAFSRDLFSPTLALVPPERAPAGLEPRDYYLRVLAAMVDKSPSLAWVDPDAQGSAMYPGTDQPATLLMIDVLAYDAVRGTATAQIGVRSPEADEPAEIGRTATATYDPQRETWTITLQPVMWER